MTSSVEAVLSIEGYLAICGDALLSKLSEFVGSSESWPTVPLITSNEHKNPPQQKLCDP